MRWGLAVVGAVAAGCASSSGSVRGDAIDPEAAALVASAPATGAADEPPRPGARPVEDAPAPKQDGWLEVASNGGTYVLHLKPPDGGWKRGTTLALDGWLASSAQPARALEDVTLAFDADMPEHLHGLNRVPRVVRRSDGVFRVEGLYLHMPGWWELYFDATRGAWTERTQLRIEVE